MSLVNVAVADNVIQMAGILPDEKKSCDDNEEKIIKCPPKSKIGYVYSPELIHQCNRVPNLKNRVTFFFHSPLKNVTMSQLNFDILKHYVQLTFNST